MKQTNKKYGGGQAFVTPDVKKIRISAILRPLHIEKVDLSFPYASSAQKKKEQNIETTRIEKPLTLQTLRGSLCMAQVIVFIHPRCPK